MSQTNTSNDEEQGPLAITSETGTKPKTTHDVQDEVIVDEEKDTSSHQRAQVQGIKGVRSQEKSSITRSITKLTKLMGERGSRTQIRTLLTKIESLVQSADLCNRKLYQLLPEKEHESIEKWFVEVAEKVDEAVTKAYAHLEERDEEPPSVSSSVSHAKSTASSTSKLSERATEARRKAQIAHLKAKQVEEESIRRKEHERIEQERREEIERVSREHERFSKEETERRLIQETKYLAAQAELEAKLISMEAELIGSGSEHLKERLRDFISEDCPGQGDDGRHSKAGKGLIGHEKQQISRVREEFDKKANSTSSWIADLPSPTKPRRFAEDVDEPKSSLQSPFRNSVPKLTLSKFDGDPLKWIDWVGMFYAIVHRSEMTSFEKMTHLQQNVVGKAKSVIAGFRYNGYLYNQALKSLESRFGKPHIVVQAHLDKLAKLSPVVENDANSVSAFATAINNIVWTFRDLGYLDDLKASSNVRSAVEKLPSPMILKWNEHLIRGVVSRPTLVTFGDWLQEQAEAHELLPAKLKTPGNGDDRRRKRNEPPANSFAAHDGERSPAPCPFADGSHAVSVCPKFASMTPDDRAEAVKEAKLCFRCLEMGHRSRECQSSKSCGVDDCEKKHHQLLHLAKRVYNTRGPDQHTKSSHTHLQPEVLLQVVPVTLHEPDKNVKTYAMLDLGSTCSLIQNSIADKLGLDGPAEKMTLNGIQKRSSIVSKKVSFGISSPHNPAERWSVDQARTVKNLNLPNTKIDMSKEKKRWPHLADLPLPAIDGNQVTVLLGADVFDLIVPLEIRTGPKGTPRAVRTALGWTAVSHLPANGAVGSNRTLTVHVTTEDEDLRLQVQEWWKTESFGCKYAEETSRSIDDKRALEILQSTTRKIGNRYETGLLWKETNTTLPNNRVMAEKQLFSLEKRLARDKVLALAYQRTIDNDLANDYAKKLSPEEASAPVKHQWFLPHHPVLNPNKPGKVRRVFNAAASFRGTSLNDHLLTGPDLLNSLIGVIMRFREERVALSADIESMFSQVAVPEEDQTVLRFLWRENRSFEPDVYQFRRHIFGAKSSPTSANYALRQTAKDNVSEFPVAAETVLKHFYMDDLFKSEESVDIAVKTHEDLTELLSRGGFRLTKWCSNSRDVLARIPECELAPSLKGLDLDGELPVERALGVAWNTESDCFVFKNQTRKSATTQRQVLSLISSIYDPLGMVAPYILRAKIFLQSLWRTKRDWDEKIGDEELAPFEKWLQELDDLASFKEPRFYRTVPAKPVKIQVHVFGDASVDAFCAVAYFRFLYPDGSVQCSFVTGKTRVAPLRQLSIPKLELQAAVMCVRLLVTVKDEHTYGVDSCHLWSDSSTVLQWIYSSSRRHPTFIANRVAEIQDSTAPSQWRHVPGRLNVADDGSRGLHAAELHPECRWLNGPAFLTQHEEFWPVQAKIKVDETDVSEMVNPADWTGATHETPDVFLDPARFSSWNKLLRTTSWILRFISNCRKLERERRSGSITVAEYNEAKEVWIKRTQADAFPLEVRGLQTKTSIPRQSRILALTPFIDETGILRAGGRLSKAPISYSTRHPIILPQKHDITRLIITDFHEHLHHEGNEHVRNVIRQEFWILNCRAEIRKISFQCAYCRRRRARPQTPMMANLPSERMKAHSPPFSYVGVDYFGPLTVKRFRKTENRYGCLFTCLVTRAVHIEVAHSLDTDSYIMALRRMISRRGKPQRIQSDNGTNFVGANRELRDCLENWNKGKIHDEMVQKGIEWHFNPPAAPHFGGVWERLVQSCKRAIKAVVGKQILTDEVLVTVMVEVEGLLNSRPLTHVSTHLSDQEALTPNHFLLGRANPNLPPDVFVDKEISSRRRWRQAQVVVNHVWQRWLKEYIPNLLERRKWTAQARNLQKGDLVLVVDTDSPRGVWPLGRVIRPIIGDSGVVRAVEVKTKGGTYVRPVAKIALLEEAVQPSKECVSALKAEDEHGAGNVPPAR